MSIRSALLLVWRFLCALLTKMHDHGSRRDSTTILPTSSPVCAQNIIINIVSPPEDQPVVDFPPSNGNLSDWISEKDQFLRRPSLARVMTRDAEKLWKRHATTTPPRRDDLSTQGGGSDRHKLDMSHSSTSSQELQVESFSSPSPAPSSGRLRCSSSLHYPISSTTPTIEAMADNHDKSGSIDEALDTSAESEYSQELYDILDKPSRTTFEPVPYQSSALSAVSVFLSDPPSNHADDPARMVIMPLYTSTPPRPSLSRISLDQRKSRLSLLPYPDLFDFSMYLSRLSHESVSGFRLSGLPPDITFPLDFAPTSVPPVITYHDRYRSAVFSRHSGQCTPTKPNSNANVFCNRTLSQHQQHPIGDISMSSIRFNSPLYPRALAHMKSRSPHISPDTSGEWNILSLDDISLRLRMACEDLSRCMWTEEEFLKIVS